MNRVGIDVGGTKCLGVVIDDSGAVVGQLRRPTPHADQLVDLLAGMHAQLDPRAPLGVGVPGLITHDGVIRASPNLVGAHDIEVGPQLRRRTGHVVTVDNDATMAALGEWRIGAARGFDDAVVVTLGTGIGGGIVMGGRLQRGAHGFAGEIGHMLVDRGGIECPCGRRGCWERYASGSSLTRMSGGLPGEELFARCRDADADALAVLEEFIGWIAVGLASLTNICDPDVIVLGGGVVESLRDHEQSVREALARSLYSSKWRPHPRLAMAELGEMAGAIGAALRTDPANS